MLGSPCCQLHMQSHPQAWWHQHAQRLSAGGHKCASGYCRLLIPAMHRSIPTASEGLRHRLVATDSLLTCLLTGDRQFCLQVTVMQACNRAACSVSVLVAALTLQCATVGAMDLSKAAEPAASESSHAHIVWALLLTAAAVASVAVGLGSGVTLQCPAQLVLQSSS